MRILLMFLLALSLTVASPALALQTSGNSPGTPPPGVTPATAPEVVGAPKIVAGPAVIVAVPVAAPVAAPMVPTPVVAPTPVAAPVAAPAPAKAVLTAPAAEIKVAPKAPIEIKDGLKVKAPEKAAAPLLDPKVPTTDAEAGVMIGLLLNAAQTGHWTVFAGLLILLMVYFSNKFGLAAKIGNKYVPWFTLGVSVVLAISAGLANGVEIWPSFKLGLLEGGVAIALWELVFKNLTNKKADGTLREAELKFPVLEDQGDVKTGPA